MFGPRWFLPKSFNKAGYDFYKSKEEILLINPDACNYECVICLFSLFVNENFKYFSDDFVASVEDENPTSKIKEIERKIIYSLREFHEYNYNMNTKSYMMTPCKHIFHTKCLQLWFKEKKECPNCRKLITEEMN